MADIRSTVFINNNTKNMKAVHLVAFVLVIIGGLNWLLHAFGWNVVDAIFGAGSLGAKIVYILVGISAVVAAVTHKKSCKDCTVAPASPTI